MDPTLVVKKQSAGCTTFQTVFVALRMRLLLHRQRHHCPGNLMQCPATLSMMYPTALPMMLVKPANCHCPLVSYLPALPENSPIVLVVPNCCPQCSSIHQRSSHCLAVDEQQELVRLTDYQRARVMEISGAEERQEGNPDQIRRCRSGQISIASVVGVGVSKNS